MKHINNILFELLLRNDCVIIPSLGGFVTNYVSARVDVETGIVSPPSKAVSFNKNLILNDGLLINFLSAKEKISYEEAQLIIRQEIQQINESLNENKRVQFQNVGFLYQSASGKVLFEQDRFFNLLLSSYGLRSVEFVPEKTEKLVSETPKESAQFIQENKSTKQQKTVVSKDIPIIPHPSIEEHQSSKRIVGKIMRYTAVAALVPLLFYGLWIPMKTDVLKSGILYSADFNPFQNQVTEEYIPSIHPEKLEINEFTFSDNLKNITTNLDENTEVFSYPVGVDLFIPVKNEVVSENVSDKIELDSGVTESKFTPTHSLHAIVGCFGDEKNAKNLIKDLQNKGYQAYEVDVKGGLHRISAGNVKNLAEMEQLRQKLSSEDFSSWVLRK